MKCRCTAEIMPCGGDTADPDGFCDYCRELGHPAVCWDDEEDE